MKTDSSNTGCIQKYIGSDFDKVVICADNIEAIKKVADSLPPNLIELLNRLNQRVNELEK